MVVQRATTAAAFVVGVLIGALMAARGGAVTAPRPRTERQQVMTPPVMVEDAAAAEVPGVRRRRRRQRDARERGKRRGASARRGHAIGAEVGAAASASDATAAAAAASAAANAAAAAVAREPPHGLTGAPVPAALAGAQDGGARTLGPYYGDLEGPGELERAVRLVSAGGELVLLHGNEFRLRMLVNLVAELNSHGLYNALLLGFTSALCDGLRVRGRIGEA